jgi:hypothetical protein
MFAHNYESIDRIIIAVEKQIEGKQQVNVNVVKDLLITLKYLNSNGINKIYEQQSTGEEQLDLGYD